jgi:TetR/AcrR family transcriptional regulator, transcriptional repressor for nem operon
MSKGEATRQRIIELAAPLFNQRGFKGCSLNAIMEATGLEKGGIYRHFESKEELAAEAFDHAWNASVVRRTQGLDDIPNHVDRLKEHISRFVYGTGTPGGCPLLNTAVDADDGNPVLRERVRKALRGWQARLRKIVEDGIAAGTVKPEVNTTEVANHIIANLEGGLVIARLERSDAPLRDVRAQLDRYLEVKVRNASPRKKSHS